MQFTLDILLSNLQLVRVWLSVFIYLSKMMAYLHLSIMNVEHALYEEKYLYGKYIFLRLNWTTFT